MSISVLTRVAPEAKPSVKRAPHPNTPPLDALRDVEDEAAPPSWQLRWTTAPADAAETALDVTPRPAPLDMRAQDLKTSPCAGPPPRDPLIYRRFVLLAGSIALSVIAGAFLYHVLRAGGVTWLEGLTIGLSVLLVAWVGFGFITATAGFVAAWGERARRAPAPIPAANRRTAILMPTYNEEPGRVMSAVQAMCEDLRRVQAERNFDVFILSDTRDEAIARAETAGFLRLRFRLGADAGVYYRRRVLNTDRKAGNLAEWVGRFGAAYDYMLVLDADSLMTAETMVALSAEMDRDPRLGLLQTAPTIVNAETPFARLQQFACRLYGPIFALGQQWWSGSESNYWGHNAIIRVAAFAESAGLPHLPGPRPFGGHILSHDFVEAALLRRRGWAVRTIAGLGGTFEETPPTLLDTAARDRRWCQGNLQHVRVVAAGGLHWISRLHLVRGILSYLTPMLWLSLVICGAFVWPAQNLGAAARGEMVALFELTLMLLVAPKLMAVVLALADPRARAGFGGTGRLLFGLLAEIALWALVAPVMMIMQCVAVIEVLLGRDSGWAAQRREGVDLSPREAWRAHRGHVALGVLAAVAALLANRYVLMWTSPVLLGLSLSSFLSLHTSRIRAGALADRRLFQIPEEHVPPWVLSRSRELRRLYAEHATHRQRIEILFRSPVPVYEFDRGAAYSPPKLRAA